MSHTGTQAAVMRAVCQGHRYGHAIAEAVGLPYERVRTPLRRLRDAGLIVAYKEQHGRSRKVYAVAPQKIGHVLLSRIWPE